MGSFSCSSWTTSPHCGKGLMPCRRHLAGLGQHRVGGVSPGQACRRLRLAVHGCPAGGAGSCGAAPAGPVRPTAGRLRSAVPAALPAAAAGRPPQGRRGFPARQRGAGSAGSAGTGAAGSGCEVRMVGCWTGSGAGAVGCNGFAGKGLHRSRRKGAGGFRLGRPRRGPVRHGSPHTRAAGPAPTG